MAKTALAYQLENIPSFENGKLTSFVHTSALSRDDLKLLEKMLKNEPYLKKISLHQPKGSHDKIPTNITKARMEILFGALINHPSLTEVEFIDFQDEDSIILKYFSALLDNKRIHTISYKNMNELVKHGHTLNENFLSFLQKLNTSPHLCNWNLPLAGIFNGLTDYPNLISHNYVNVKSKEIIEENISQANKLIDGVHKLNNYQQECYISIDVDLSLLINNETAKRLPLALLLAEQQGKREDFIKTIIKYADKDKVCLKRKRFPSDEYDYIYLPIESFMTRNDFESRKETVHNSSFPNLPMNVEATQPSTPLQLPNLTNALQKVQAIDLSQTRQEIEEGRQDPTKLMTLGKEQEELLSEISLGSLSATLERTAFSTPVSSLTLFIDEIKEAEKLIELYVENEKRQAAWNAQNNTTSKWANLFNRRPKDLPTDNENLKSLVQAIDHARRGGNHLQNLSTMLGGLLDQRTESVKQNVNIVRAYQKISSNLGQICETGSEVLTEWKSSAQETTTHHLPFFDDSEPLHEYYLSKQLEKLGRTRQEVEAQLVTQALRGRVSHELAQGLGEVRSSVIRQLAAHTEDFIGNAVAFQDSLTITSAVNAAAQLKSNNAELLGQSVRTTMTSLELLTESMKTRLLTLSEQATPPNGIPQINPSPNPQLKM